MTSANSERNTKLKRSIIGLFGIRMFNALVSFILIPLYLIYISETELGVWFTISSFLAWFGLMDFGLSNGLRNKFAESIAKGQWKEAKGYVSTAYGLIGLISLVVLVLFWCIYPLVDWNDLFNQSDMTIEGIGFLALVVFSMLCLQFVAQIIKVILIADQRPQIAGGMNALANALSLIGIAILVLTTPPGEGSVLYLGIVIGASNLIVPLLATFLYFTGRYKDVAPSLKTIDLKKYGSVMTLGVQFFVMQAAGLIVMTTDNMIITQAIENGTEDVTPYNIAYRYFNIVITLFMVVTTPFWSAFTDAWTRKDVQWIKNVTRKTIRIWAIASIGVVVMILIAPWVYKYWVDVEVPYQLSLLMAWWVIINTGLQVFAYFLSGTGKIRLSLFHSVLMIFLNIPLSVYFAKYLEMGSAGVLLASCICISLRLFQPIQYYLLITGKAKGIWNK